jgi:hypothetical protein
MTKAHGELDWHSEFHFKKNPLTTCVRRSSVPSPPYNFFYYGVIVDKQQ